MLALQPELDKILVINEQSITDAIRGIDAVEVEMRRSRVEIEHMIAWIWKRSPQKLQSLVKTILIFVGSTFFKDKTGRFFTYKDNLQQIRKITNTPIYGLWDFYFRLRHCRWFFN